MTYDWDFSVAWESLPLLLKGLSFSILLAVETMALGSFIGLAVAIARIRHIPLLNPVLVAYVEFFRNTPALAQLLWIYYVLPVLIDVRFSAWESAVIAFSLNIGAFMSEIFRAGILSVDKGQREAAASIGLTGAQIYRRIILPQAFTNVLPATASMWLSLVKDTSIASVISVHEMMYEARALAVNTYRPVEVLTVCGAIYFVLVYAQSTLIERIYGGRLRKGRRRQEEDITPEPLTAQPRNG